MCSRWFSTSFVVSTALLAVALIGLPVPIFGEDVGSSAEPATVITKFRTVDDNQPAAKADTDQAPATPTADASSQSVSEPATQESAPAADEPAVAEPETISESEAPLKVLANPEGSEETSDEASEDKLQPVPDPVSNGKVTIKTASFKGITPGQSTKSQLVEAWGNPKEMAVQDGAQVHLYSIDPFDQIEVSFSGEKVASIIIRLERAVPAAPLAEQLKLAEIRPVLISDELGHILGQSFPERGVLFAFEPAGDPGKATMRVVDVILEPVNGEAFVLRAETYLDSHLSESAADLKHAIQLRPESARAYWLHARAAAALGDLETALASSGQAVRLEPKNAQYLVTRAQILGQSERPAEAIRQAESAVENAENRPHIKAKALCLLGDLASAEPQPDYAKALEHHMEAITTADPLINSPHPAVRLAASEVLVDAHLGAAQDIAWGDWENKEVAVTTWLKRSEDYAKAMIAAEAGDQKLLFRVATRALAACVGLKGELSPDEWTQRTLAIGEQMLEGTESSSRKRSISWSLGLALYDSVQVYQMREEQDLAIEVGRRAIEFLREGMADDGRPSDALLLGRLYFRLGTIYAISKSDHQQAVTWFDKSVPLFQKAADDIPPHEVGRLGETLVSMGVSYWETGNRDVALQQTETGVDLIEAAVEAGLLEKVALEVPYSNLATMHRQLGQDEEADKFLEMASEHGKTLR